MNIQSKCKTIGEYGCLAFCYLWCARIPEESLITDFDKLVGKGAIDKDCTVLDAVKVYAHFGVRANVTKSFAPPAKGAKYVAKWTNNGYNHFVGMIDGQVTYNPLDVSVCITSGKIDTSNPYDPPYRIITMEVA
jgi:hypothetical protein